MHGHAPAQVSQQLLRNTECHKQHCSLGHDPGQQCSLIPNTRALKLPLLVKPLLSQGGLSKCRDLQGQVHPLDSQPGAARQAGAPPGGARSA